MATTATELLTVEQWMDLPEEQTQRTELIDGEIVPMGNARDFHELLKSRWAMALSVWAHGRKGIGVFSETMYKLKPATGLIPDVSLQMPPRPIRYAAYERAPEVAIEIVSSEGAVFIEHKISLYLAHGCQLVLIVYPEDRTLHARRPGGAAHAYALGDTFSTPDLLPGFSLDLNALFADI